jgi:uncharacterized protein YjiS (DUF1127 family)
MCAKNVLIHARFAWLSIRNNYTAVQHKTYLWVENGSAQAESRKEPIMLVAILNFIRAWRRYNTSLTELYQLGDRELADIGITRSDIPRIAWDDANR